MRFGRDYGFIARTGVRPSRAIQEGADLTANYAWQDFLVSRMLGAHSEQNDVMWRNNFWRFWRKWSGVVLGFLLALAGSGLLVFARGLGRDFGTALLIAGVLTLTVDPYIKGKMQREAALDIFHHMLGFKLPSKIQERLKQIVEDTEWYRTDTTLHCTLSESGDNVVFDIDQEFTVVNATRHTLGFPPVMEFERTEFPVLRRIICFEEPSYGMDAELKSYPEEPKALAYHGQPITIEPGGKRRLKYQYRIQRPFASGVWAIHFKYPTIGLALTVKSPETLEITASPAEQECAGEWRYVEKLFMPGDHTEIRWDRAKDLNRPTTELKPIEPPRAKGEQDPNRV